MPAHAVGALGRLQRLPFTSNLLGRWRCRRMENKRVRQSTQASGDQRPRDLGEGPYGIRQEQQEYHSPTYCADNWHGNWLQPSMHLMRRRPPWQGGGEMQQPQQQHGALLPGAVNMSQHTQILAPHPTSSTFVDASCRPGVDRDWAACYQANSIPQINPLAASSASSFRDATATHGVYPSQPNPFDSYDGCQYIGPAPVVAGNYSADIMAHPAAVTRAPPATCGNAAMPLSPRTALVATAQGPPNQLIHHSTPSQWKSLPAPSVQSPPGPQLHVATAPTYSAEAGSPPVTSPCSAAEIGGTASLQPNPVHMSHKQKTAPLRDWLMTHRYYPYPTKQEKANLSMLTGMEKGKIMTWFANARRQINEIGLEKWSGGKYKGKLPKRSGNGAITRGYVSASDIDSDNDA